MTDIKGRRRSVVSNRVCFGRCGAWLILVTLVAVISVSENKCVGKCGRPSAVGGEQAKSRWIEAARADELLIVERAWEV